MRMRGLTRIRLRDWQLRYQTQKFAFDFSFEIACISHLDFPHVNQMVNRKVHASRLSALRNQDNPQQTAFAEVPAEQIHCISH